MSLNVARLASYPVAATRGAALRGRDLAQDLSDPAKSERRPHCPYCSSPKRDRWWLESGFAGLHSHHRHSTAFSISTHRTATPPRYVLDSMPVSYESSLRF